MLNAIQLIETAKDQAEAQEMLDCLTLQVDYLGGRLLPPGGVVSKSTWRVQAFFADVAASTGDWLPDGMRRVVILDSQRSALGIQEGA